MKEDIVFDAIITVEDRISKKGNLYQIMKIGIQNKFTGEILDIHEVYVKESLRQKLKEIKKENKNEKKD